MEVPREHHEPMARFQSSKTTEVIYEVYYYEVPGSSGYTCSCPGFTFRNDCQHIKAIQRFEHWGLSVPDHILPPPESWEVMDK